MAGPLAPLFLTGLGGSQLTPAALAAVLSNAAMVPIAGASGKLEKAKRKGRAQRKAGDAKIKAHKFDLLEALGGA